MLLNRVEEKVVAMTRANHVPERQTYPEGVQNPADVDEGWIVWLRGGGSMKRVTLRLYVRAGAGALL